MSFWQTYHKEILKLIDEIFGLPISDYWEIISVLVYFLSLLISFNLFMGFVYLELKNKNEIGFWLKLRDFKKRFKRFQSLKKLNYEDVKASYLQDKIQGLKEIKNFLAEVLEELGFEGQTLEEKINDLPFEEDEKQNLKKAVRIVELIQNKQNVNLSEEEIKIVYAEFEKALFLLNLIEKEEMVAESLK